MKRLSTFDKRHEYAVQAEVRIVADLSGQATGAIGCDAEVVEQLPHVSSHPQYKVVIYGEGRGFIGGVFEVDERDLGPRT